MKAYQGHADNQSHRRRFRVSVAVAAFALAGCNSNHGVNLSSHQASQVFAGDYADCSPYDPTCYAQNQTGHGGGGH
jgi:hypothetical protein